METNQCGTEILVTYPNTVQVAYVVLTDITRFTDLQEKAFLYNEYR